MTLVLLRYPALIAASLVTAALCIPAARTGKRRYVLPAGGCAVLTLLAALTCALPYAEVLALLLPSLLCCLTALEKGDAP